jgi:S1-C subfamily serine protease
VVIPGFGVAPFLVTNKHVIKDATQGRFFFTKSAGKEAKDGPAIGRVIDIKIDNFEKGWHGHPDPDVDIAVFQYGRLLMTMIENRTHPYFRPLPTSMFPTEEEISSLRIMEEVAFVGYPNGMYDEVNYLPLIRHGTTATPPSLNYGGRPHVLIDASVFPGSSGSPVFIANPDTLSLKTDGSSRKEGTRPIRLLGLISAVFTQPQIGPVVQQPIPTTQTAFARLNQMIDIGVVIKSSLILETISDALRTHEMIPPLVVGSK